ncbi:hypothetical protein [Symbiopectobacterium purcellii]|uniref:Saccharopine dehydrogenase NADP binding domain-containing protein n=1 Tax=Symbiopectobacterium purcellii TaxID=2871826 RepID=A0ABX9AMH7_9ENTR|nr:hypothetical protein [Symbiopectobacterium purcellii]QZN95996.1 hypothetical protein K6K13_00355 [Symbiopectobacterium purcellii]
MRIAILGAVGNAGRLLAQQLAPELDDRAELLLVGRRDAPLAALCEQINHQAGRTLAHTACADLSDLPRMHAVLAGTQLVVVTAALGEHTAPLAALVLEIGADWLDIMLSTPAKWQALTALAPAMTQQGRCFITDGGFHPGLPAAMARWAANRMDTLTQAEIYAALRIDWQAGSLSDATLAEALDEFTAFDMHIWAQGRRRRLNLFALPRFTFAVPIGQKACTPMPLGEMQALIAAIPTLQRANFYIAGFSPLCDWLLLPAIVMLTRCGARTLALRTLRHMLTHYASSPPPHQLEITLMAEGRVAKDNVSMTLSLSGSDPYLMTVLPTIACIRQWLSDPPFPPGLHHQAMIVEPERFFDDLHHTTLTLSSRVTSLTE